MTRLGIFVLGCVAAIIIACKFANATSPIATAVYTVDNVSDLRSNTYAPVSAGGGVTIFLQGFYQPGDGGAAGRW